MVYMYGVSFFPHISFIFNNSLEINWKKVQNWNYKKLLKPMFLTEKGFVYFLYFTPFLTPNVG